MDYKKEVLDVLNKKLFLNYKIGLYGNPDKEYLINNNLEDSFSNLKSMIIEKVEDREDFYIFDEISSEVWDNTHHLWITTQYDYMYAFDEEIVDYLRKTGGLQITDNFELNYLGVIGIERYISNKIYENQKDFYKDLQVESLKDLIRNDEIQIYSEEKMERILDFIEEEIEYKDLAEIEVDIQDNENLTNNLIEFKENFLEEMERELKNYWIIEFSESYGHERYTGKILTKEVLDDIKSLDEEEYRQNGFRKFYFDHIENGEVTEHIRVDIGDVYETNKGAFDYLYEEVEKCTFEEIEIDDLELDEEMEF